MSPNPTHTHLTEDARARGGDPDGPPREPAEDPDTTEEEVEPPAPINAEWKAARPALEREFGAKVCKAWLEDLIAIRREPLKSGGERLILGCPTTFWRSWVMDRLSERIERILGMPIALEVDHRSAGKNARRKAQLAEAAQEPKAKRRRTG